MDGNDVVMSLREIYKENMKEYLDLQSGLNKGSEYANRFIDNVSKGGKSWGVYVNREAVKTQTAFLAGMIAATSQLDSELDYIESAIEKRKTNDQ